MPSRRFWLASLALTAALLLPLAVLAQTAPDAPGGFLPDYPDPAERRREGPGLLDVTLKLAFVLALIAAAAAAYRRWGRSMPTWGGDEVIRLWANRSLGIGSELYLLEIGDRLLLVGRSGGAMATLSEFTDPSVIADLKSQCDGPIALPGGAGLMARLLRRGGSA